MPSLIQRYLDYNQSADSVFTSVKLISNMASRGSVCGACRKADCTQITLYPMGGIHLFCAQCLDTIDTLGEDECVNMPTDTEIKTLLDKAGGEDSNYIFVLVKGVFEELYCLEALVGDTVADIKQKIYEKDGYPTEEQRLIHAGKSLSDHCKLGHLGLQMGQKVHLVLELEGGGKRARTDYTEIARDLRLTMQPTAEPQVNTAIQELVSAGEGQSAAGTPDNAFEALVNNCSLDGLQNILEALPGCKNIETKIQSAYGLLVPTFAQQIESLRRIEQSHKELEKAVRFSDIILGSLMIGD